MVSVWFLQSCELPHDAIQLTVQLHDVTYITVHSPRLSADSFAQSINHGSVVGLWTAAAVFRFCRYTRAKPNPISENPVIMVPNR